MTSSLRPAGSTGRWRRLRAYVLERDGWRCQVPVDEHGDAAEDGPACALPLTSYDPAAGARPSDACVDHVLERATGAADVDNPANLRAACRRHNAQRSARRPRRRVPTSREW